jgi:hypothetical protein
MSGADAPTDRRSSKGSPTAAVSGFTGVFSRLHEAVTSRSSGQGGEGPEAPQQVDLRKARRKLSIMSDNALVDGISEIHLDETSKRSDEVGVGVPCVVSSYAGSSKKGFAPYNNKKKNQDALIM